MVKKAVKMRKKASPKRNMLKFFTALASIVDIFFGEIDYPST